MIPNKVLLPKNHRFHYLLILILVVPVFVDLANGFLIWGGKVDFSVGVLYRSLLFVLTVPFFLYIRERWVQIYLLTITGLFLCLLPIWYFLTSHYLPVVEIQAYVEILFPFALLCFFLYLLQHFEVDIKLLMKLVSLMAFITAASIIFSFFTDIGLQTYEKFEQNYGVKSFFKAQNAISLLMVLSLPMSCYLLLTELKFKYLVVVISILMAMLFLSTRTGLLGSVGVAFIYLFSMGLFGRKEVKINRIVKFSLFTVLMIGLVVGSYFLFQFIMEYGYMVNKLAILLEQSPRAKLEAAGSERIAERSWLQSLLGEGSYSFRRFVEVAHRGWSRTAHGKNVEQDILDMIGYYGYIFGGLILLFPTFMGLRMTWIFFRKRTLLNLTFLLCILLFIGHSFLAGHAIKSPTVATVLVVVYVYIVKYRVFEKRGESLPGVGR